MRIAFITFEYPPNVIGGAGVYAYHLSRYLARRGHDVCVFTPGDCGVRMVSEPRDEPEIHSVPCNRAGSKALQYWLRLPDEVQAEHRRSRFDVVHVNGLSYWFAKSRLCDSAHIMTVHHLAKDAASLNTSNFVSRLLRPGAEISYLVGLMERRAVRSIDRIIAVSLYTKQRTMEKYHVPSHLIDVIYSGLERPSSEIKQLPDDWRRAGIDHPGRRVILFVGRVDDRRKGLDVLVRAIAEPGFPREILLVAAGKGDASKMRRLAEELGVAKNVLFLGFVDQASLHQLYRIADVYACPSRLEGFGMTLLEATAFGSPIVASNVGAIPELITNDVNGLLVPSENPRELSFAIQRILNDGLLRARISHRDKNEVWRDHSWENTAKLAVDAYSKTMEAYAQADDRR